MIFSTLHQNIQVIYFAYASKIQPIFFKISVLTGIGVLLPAVQLHHGGLDLVVQTYGAVVVLVAAVVPWLVVMVLLTPEDPGQRDLGPEETTAARTLTHGWVAGLGVGTRVGINGWEYLVQVHRRTPRAVRHEVHRL